MILTLSWLKNHLNTKASINEIIENQNGVNTQEGNLILDSHKLSYHYDTDHLAI